MRREFGLVEEGRVSESFLASPQPSFSFIIQDGGIEYSYLYVLYRIPKYACSAGYDSDFVDWKGWTCDD